MNRQVPLLLALMSDLRPGFDQAAEKARVVQGVSNEVKNESILYVLYSLLCLLCIILFPKQQWSWKPKMDSTLSETENRQYSPYIVTCFVLLQDQSSIRGQNSS
mmetsp:Transcript_29692/g.71480  ORF Transcript_29692/g.71480 Transcript_29692/m.71480 type:complete len:104 (+) Transcript_29692:11-322(+)